MLGVTLGVLALGVSVVGAWYARAAIFPQRKELLIMALTPVPMLNAKSGTVGGVTVSRNGTVLTNPYVATIILESLGRFDIPSEAFDAGKPICIDLGVPIIEILGRDDLEVSVDQARVLVGPNLLKRGTRQSVQLLLDGLPTLDHFPEKVEHDLVDVKVTRRKGGRTLSPLQAILQTLGVGTSIVGGLFFAGVLVFQAVQGFTEPKVSIAPDHGNSGTAITLAGSRFERYEVIEVLLQFRPPDEAQDQGAVTPSTTGTDPAGVESQRASSEPAITTSVEPSPSPLETNSLGFIEVALGPWQADAQGNWEGSFELPRSVPIGEVTLTVNGSKTASYEFDSGLSFDVVGSSAGTGKPSS